ncbi:hypothetical protein RFI_06665, partial [Reticulomyxa filosa]
VKLNQSKITNMNVGTNIKTNNNQKLRATAKCGRANSLLGLHIYPPQLTFSNVMTQYPAKSTILIQNASNHSKQLKICGVRPEHQSLFEFENRTTFVSIASGCSFRVIVKFHFNASLVECFDYNLLLQNKKKDNCDLMKSNKTENINSELFVSIRGGPDDGLIKIPISVTIPGSKILFEHTVDMGTIFCCNAASKDIWFQNKGQMKGTFEITVPKEFEQQISFTPNKGTIPSVTDAETEKNGLKVTVNINPQNLGIFCCPAEVTFDGSTKARERMNIIANICEHKLAMLDKETEEVISKIELAPVYYGETRTIRVKLVNNAAIPAHYCFYIVDGDENDTNDTSPAQGQESEVKKKGAKDDSGSPQKQQKPQTNDSKNEDDGKTKGSKIVPLLPAFQSFQFDDINSSARVKNFVIFPEEGKLDSYAAVDVEITFHPEFKNEVSKKESKVLETIRSAKPPKGDVETMRCKLICYSHDIKNSYYSIPITGQCCPIMAEVSQQEFDFGDCLVHDKRDTFFTITNKVRYFFFFF